MYAVRVAWAARSLLLFFFKVRVPLAVVRWDEGFTLAGISSEFIFIGTSLKAPWSLRWAEGILTEVPVTSIYFREFTFFIGTLDSEGPLVLSLG